MRDPDTLNPFPSNDFALRLSPDYWLFWDDTVYHNGDKRKLKISTLYLGKNDSVGCCVTRDGELELFLQGGKRVVGMHNVPTDKPLWGVVCICGQAKTIQSEFYCGELYSCSEVCIVLHAHTHIHTHALVCGCTHTH